MGQYYKAIILAPRGPTKEEVIRLWVSPYDYEGGGKLMGHSQIGQPFVSAFEFLLSPEGSAYMSRVVWAGDYADDESLQQDKPEAQNLYCMAEDGHMQIHAPILSTDKYRYIVNHDKQQYVDKDRSRFDLYGYQLHPLPLLTVEGNGRGGGDYRGPDMEKVGIWARDVISVETEPPASYTELKVEFI